MHTDIQGAHRAHSQVKDISRSHRLIPDSQSDLLSPWRSAEMYKQTLTRQGILKEHSKTMPPSATAIVKARGRGRFFKREDMVG